MSTKVRYTKNMILLEEYLCQNPELRAFVSVFKTIVEANKAITTISIGQRIDSNTFLPLLTSRVEAPRIRFSSFNNIPVILLQNHLQTLCTLPLHEVENIDIHSETSEGRTDHRMYFYCNNHDYKITCILSN